jgi:hypothetical protein
MSRFTGRAYRHEDKLIALMILVVLSWRWDLPIDLYPSAPPLIQVRGKPATNPSTGI